MTRGGSRIGSGAPLGNTNALKSVRYSPRYIRGAAILSLAPSLREVLLALRRNNRALGGDRAARGRQYRALAVSARELAYHLARTDTVLLEAILGLVERLAPGLPRQLRSTHARPSRARPRHHRPPPLRLGRPQS
jgi:hypothetical protein